MSSFLNPAPPIGSGMPVDVEIGEEFDVSLSFDPNLSIAAPIPLPATWLLLALPAFGLVRRRPPAG